LRRLLASLFLALSLATAAGLVAAPAVAQGSMRALGGGSPVAEAEPAEAPGALSRLLFEIRRMQRDLQTRLAGAVEAVSSGATVWPLLVLLGLSFAYGVLHAAGPGHGKVVISSYLLAGEGNVRRGAVLAALASLVQAVSAVALVGVLALALGIANMTTVERVRTLDAVSYGIVALLGFWMLWRTLREIAAHRRGHHDHAHHHHDHGHGDLARVAAAEWREAAVVVLAVGIRPCSGAVIVLLFALAQGLFLAGILSTLAMSVGTAITVSVLAALSVAVRRGVLTLSGTSRRWQEVAAGTLGVVGAAAVASFGVLFFLAAL
jgi:nickel/cobalt exporter